MSVGCKMSEWERCASAANHDHEASGSTLTVPRPSGVPTTQVTMAVESRPCDIKYQPESPKD